MKMKRADPYVAMPSSIFTSKFWAKLSAPAKAVYPVLLKYSNGNTNKCWPGTATLVDESGVCRNSVFAAIKELVEKNAIGKEMRFDDKGHNLSNLYTMYVPCEDDDNPSASDALPQCTKCTTPSASDAPELPESELAERTINTPTGSADAEAPVEPTADSLPDPPKPDPYQAVLDVYELANMPEPPRCEITPLLRAMKQALVSGWQPSRIASAWSNARSRGNPQVWSLAYTLRHLTEAEGLSTRPPGPRGANKPGEDEIRASVKNAFKDVFGGAK